MRLVCTKYAHETADEKPRWRHLYWLQIWPLGGTSCISYKFGNQMAPIPNLATRWHQLQIWPPDGISCIATWPGIAMLVLSASWYLHQPDSHQSNQQNILYLEIFPQVYLGPMKIWCPNVKKTKRRIAWSKKIKCLKIIGVLEIYEKGRCLVGVTSDWLDTTLQLNLSFHTTQLSQSLST